MTPRFVPRRTGAALACMVCLAVTAHAEPAPDAPVETERFRIERFAVEGSSLLPMDEIARLVAPYLGERREYGDIQRALEAVELAYRSRGYAAVQVYAPEQEITGGVIRLQVTETVVDRLILTTALAHFDENNLRAALPALREGTTPNALDLSRQIALNNENPAKQIEVVLGVGQSEGKVDAKISVAESDPLKVFASLDNTGSASTGEHRLALGAQHANLWNRDHVGTFAWTTSPEKPEQVRIMSLSYRLPVYAWAGAVDLILASSNVNAGTTQTTAGPLDFAGSGSVFGLRYTHALPREGDTNAKLILGWDVKANDSTCTLGAFGAAGCGAAAVDVTLRPLSLAYIRSKLAAGAATETSLSLAVNLPGGRNGTDADFQAARPSPIGRGGARARYSVLRGAFTRLGTLEGDWQTRLAVTLQWTSQPLLAQEQLGMAGANAVRGFQEREVARDTGVQATAEAYTPNFADATGLPGSLRALAFLDAASGRNHLLPGEIHGRHNLAALGAGVRYALGKNVAAKLDFARVVLPNGVQDRGDIRGHFSLTLSF